jgi:hypothetical protein
MALPTRSDVLTLGYTGFAQPAVYIEAKALSPSSSTLAYTMQAQPVFGLSGSSPPPPPPPSSNKYIYNIRKSKRVII